MFGFQISPPSIDSDPFPIVMEEDFIFQEKEEGLCLEVDARVMMIKKVLQNRCYREMQTR